VEDPALVGLDFLVEDHALVILAYQVEDHAYLLGAYRDHPFLLEDPCLVVYSMDVLEEGLSYHLEEDLSFHLEAYRLMDLPFLVVVLLGLEVLKVYHLSSRFIFFP
jgi:hypothetical protein